MQDKDRTARMLTALASAKPPRTLIGIYPDDDPIFKHAIVAGLRVEALNYPLIVEASADREEMTVETSRTLNDRREVEEWAEEEFGSGGWEIVSLNHEARYHHALRAALAAVFAAADLFARLARLTRRGCSSTPCVSCSPF